LAWEKRKNGKEYFYLCKRLPDGRVRRQYCGNGFLAHAEWMRLVLKREDKKREQRIKDEFLYLDSIAESYAQSTRLLMEAQLYAAGFHNPKCRGWRKRRSEKVIKPAAAEEAKEDTDETAEYFEESVTLEEVVRRCRAGDQNALVTLRRLMKEHPDLYKKHGHITAKVQAAWISALSGPDLFDREMMLTRTRELRQGLLAEGNGSHLDRLIVDQVVTSHVEQGFHGLIEARCLGKGIEMPKYQVDASQRATRRYEKSLSALSTVRTLMRQPEPVSEEEISETEQPHVEIQPHWNAPSVPNRMTEIFDKTLEALPLN